MLLPFEWAVLTVGEARILMRHIEVTTASEGLERDYKKMSEAGVLEVYDRLRSFVNAADQYEGSLRGFNPDNFARDDHEHR